MLQLQDLLCLIGGIIIASILQAKEISIFSIKGICIAIPMLWILAQITKIILFLF